MDLHQRSRCRTLLPHGNAHGPGIVVALHGARAAGPFEVVADKDSVQSTVDRSPYPLAISIVFEVGGHRPAHCSQAVLGVVD